jgi:SNF2 family DNA or RNA helicase
MPHDLIDNRSDKLLDYILTTLPTTERARFAVGYLFLSGLKPLREQLERLTEIRLLIGNTTDRETIETLAEGYKRLEPVAEAAESWRYPKRVAQQQAAQATAANLADAFALMDQMDEDEAIIQTVIHLIEEHKLKVRVYTRGRLHAKAYIFDYGPVYDLLGNPLPRPEKGLAVVGSSNLTLSGIELNAELNVVVHGNANHAGLVDWFEKLWEEGQDFDAALMTELKRSWAGGQAAEVDGKPSPVTPYDIYLKTLYELVRDRLEGGEKQEVLFEDDITRHLADFQKVAVRQAVGLIRDYGGCFISDVVGLGKSFIGAAIVKHFESAERARPLILCPKSLVEMWERYNEVYRLNARVLSIGFLHENEGHNLLLEDARFKDRDFVLVDESHHFRHSDTQRYGLLQEFTKTGRRCVLLTATPRDKSARDIYHQLKLFHPDDRTLLPIDPPNLREFFKGVENNERRLQDLLVHILIRRTRSHILRWYGYDSETHQAVDPQRWPEYAGGERRAYIKVDGQPRFFPRRELETVEYSIDDTYNGLYQQLRGYMGRARDNRAGQLDVAPDELTFARYGLWHYVQPEKQKRAPYTDLHRAGVNLRGLIRIMLFKRFESSVYAFCQTLSKLLRIHTDFLKALDAGFVPAGEKAQLLLYESDEWEETQLIDALREVSGRYELTDFNDDLLRQHIQQDQRLLKQMLELVEPIKPQQDTKLQTLMSWLKKPVLAKGKRLVFTQYADTARYLFENLNPNGKRNDIDVVYSSDKSRKRLVGRFAPIANPWYRPQAGESELNTVIATDVLSEGLNLQDCDKVINYDLHWSPVRLIQRFGRVDRIGSTHDRVYAYNFLPETALDRELGLRDTLNARIKEIHETIGEDAAVLDPGERLNEEAMYAIYERGGKQLGLFEEEQEEPFDLNEAEQLLRQLRAESPELFNRITNLRDGIRAARAADQHCLFAFFRAGRYQQLSLLDAEGNIITRDLSEILRVICCAPEEPAQPLPPGYNAALMAAKKRFDEEVYLRQSQQRHAASLSQAQRYVLRELRVLYNALNDEDEKQDLLTLEEAYRQSVSVSVHKEINRLRRSGIAGSALHEELRRIYFQYNLRDAAQREQSGEENNYPRIVCSSGLAASGHKGSDG